MGTNITVALLLEDEPLIAMDIEQTLARTGFNVTTVTSCADALGWLGFFRPGIVIVDIILQDGPCHKVVAKLVDDGIPFIVHSGDHPSNHADTPFANGTWLGKPADSAQIIRIATEILTAERHGQVQRDVMSDRDRLLIPPLQ